MLERRRLGRVPAVICVVAVAFLAIFGLGWVVAGQVVHVAENLPQYQGEIERKVRLFRSQPKRPVAQRSGSTNP